MTFIVADRVKERVFVVGTGDVSLSGVAVAGFQAFDAVLTTGDTTWYTIAQSLSGSWEVGLGTLLAGNKIGRTEENVLSSSNGNHLVDFPAGLADVFMTMPAASAAIPNPLPVIASAPFPVVAAAPIPAEIVQGELVKVAFRSDQVAFYTAGSGTAVFSIQSQFYNNDDANETVALNVPAGVGNRASIRFVAYGKVVGIRYQRTNSTPPFSVAIDGISYRVPNTAYKWNGRASIISSTVDGDSNTLIVEGLPDGAHSVEIILAADLPGGVLRTLNFYGLMLERRVGYRERHGYQNVATQGTVPSSSTAVANTNNCTALRKIQYVNTVGSPTTVAIAYNGVSVASVPLAAAGTAGDTGEFDPGDYIAFSTLLQHSSAGTVRYTAYGRR
jgi:hypothetical protein